MRITSQKLAADTAIHAVATAFMGVRQLVFIPLVARLLGAEAYGIWSQVTVSVGLLAPVLLLGFGESCARYFPAMSDRRRMSREIGAMLGWIWGVMLIFGAAVIVSRRSVSLLVFARDDLAATVVLLIALVAARVTWLFAQGVFRSRHRIRVYALIQIATTGLEILVSSILLLSTSAGLAGVLAVFIGTEAIIAFALLVVVGRWVGWPRGLHLEAARKHLRFALPLIPNALLLWVVNLSDRFVITHAFGLAKAGVYAASYELSYLITVFMGPIALGFYPAASAMWDGGERDRLSRYAEMALRYYLLLAVPSMAGLLYLAPSLLRLLAGAGFVTHRGLLALLLVGLGIYALNRVTAYPISLAERTRWLVPTSVLAAALNLGLNLWLVPRWGIVAAAGSTALCYALRSGILLLLARRLVPLRVDPRFLLKAAIASGGMVLVLSCFRPVHPLHLVGMVGLGAAVYVLLMVVLRGIGRREWTLLRMAIGGVLPRTERGHDDR
jgi:O-antigen/teichoic acid export membrane protein